MDKITYYCATTSLTKQNWWEFVLDCDIINTGMEPVLFQIQIETEKMAAYARRSLSKTEQTILCHNKRNNGGCIHYKINCRESTLQPGPITVHHSCDSWLEWLSQYDYNIIHRSGFKHRKENFCVKFFSEPCLRL